MQHWQTSEDHRAVSSALPADCPKRRAALRCPGSFFLALLDIYPFSHPPRDWRCLGRPHRLRPFRRDHAEDMRELPRPVHRYVAATEHRRFVPRCPVLTPGFSAGEVGFGYAGSAFHRVIPEASLLLEYLSTLSFTRRVLFCRMTSFQSATMQINPLLCPHFRAVHDPGRRLHQARRQHILLRIMNTRPTLMLARALSHLTRLPALPRYHSGDGRGGKSIYGEKFMGAFLPEPPPQGAEP